MLIAQLKKKENIAEYLLYMWQVEDILRAFNLDITKIKEHIVDKYDLDTATKEAITTWYAELIDMMRIEGVRKKGHLQINLNVLYELEELSQALLKTRSEIKYQQRFLNASQDLFEMSKKSGIPEEKPMEIAFNILYGLLTMKLKKQTINESTLASQKRIQALISILAYKFHNPPKTEN